MSAQITKHHSLSDATSPFLERTSVRLDENGMHHVWISVSCGEASQTIADPKEYSSTSPARAPYRRFTCFLEGAMKMNKPLPGMYAAWKRNLSTRVELVFRVRAKPYTCNLCGVKRVASWREENELIEQLSTSVTGEKGCGALPTKRQLPATASKDSWSNLSGCDLTALAIPAPWYQRHHKLYKTTA